MSKSKQLIINVKKYESSELDLGTMKTLSAIASEVDVLEQDYSTLRIDNDKLKFENHLKSSRIEEIEHEQASMVEHCDDCHAEARDKGAMFTKLIDELDYLISWIKAEAEHFEGSTPDRMEEVEAVLLAAKRKAR